MTEQSTSTEPAADAGYIYGGSMGWISRLLCFSAGADTQLLKYCPQYDIVKMQCLGGTVLATTVLAFLASSYAFYIVFAPNVSSVSFVWAIAACLLGMVWAAVIFNIDRFIVALTGHGDGTEKMTPREMWRAVPRICMAIVIGLTIAKPLEIRIMQTEIEAEIIKRKGELQSEYAQPALKRRDVDLEKFQRVKDELQDAVRSREAKILNLNQRTAKLEQDFVNETQGSRGNGRGYGSVAKKLEAQLNERRQELVALEATLRPEIQALDLKISKVNDEINRVNKRFEEERTVAIKDAEKFDGLINRIRIASDISPWASWLITFLLIFIEVAPILFKMMVPLSSIDYLVENQKRLSVIRRGIDVTLSLESGKDDAQHLRKAVYHEVELDIVSRIGKMKVEAELTQEQLERQKQLVIEDMKQNPSSYFERIKPAE